MAECYIDGCGGRALYHGLCNKHRLRLLQAGTTDPGPKAHGTLEERFWRKVEKTDGCWNWIGGKRPNGYGQIQQGGKGSPTMSAHRASYTIHNGPVPEGKVIMHTCDNRGCVNPAHLIVGTYRDNMQDMHQKGRAKPGRCLGEASGKAKLTDEMVRFIRANPQRGHKDLADELGVKPNTVRGVRIGRTWTHIT